MRPGVSVLGERREHHMSGPEVCHELWLDRAPRALGYRPDRDLGAWRAEVKETLTGLLGLMPDRVPLEVTVEWEEQHADHLERRFSFTAEEGARVPCHLLVPRKGDGPHPVMICLQGHSTGMHISLGRAKYPGDEQSIAGGRDFGLQAVRQGYAALVMEQRSFGERRDQRPDKVVSLGRGCHHASMVALMLGRTLVGERVWDVSRAIDALASFGEVDSSRVACMGNSGGGTTTLFAACVEERLCAAMPSCYVCTFRHSLASIDHCACNYVPGILNHFEMGDLAVLIAPRPLVVVAGREDPIFPLEGVRETFATIQAIYDRYGVGDRCRLVIGEGGHRFYPELGWPAFGELTQGIMR